jgi:HD superfamily phosphohydrolase
MLEVDIIDTGAFQRLRGIRQLGTTAQVYPTALHTRFDHALGTLAMAGQIVNAIRANMHSSKEEKDIQPDQEVIIRLYALLHDITHIPFGHTLEDELGIFERHDRNQARINYFLGPESEIGSKIKSALGDQQYQRFMKVFSYLEDSDDDSRDGPLGTERARLSNDDVFMNDIVSNTLCADLLDYMQRDSYFCNVGASMEYRFLNYLYLTRDEDKRLRVFVRLWKEGKPTPRRDTLTDLTRLLELRYMLAERVYFHHSKLASGAMLGRAVLEMKMAGELSDDQTLWRLTDERLLQKLETSESTIARKLGSALASRSLYVLADAIPESQLVEVSKHDHGTDYFKQAMKDLDTEDGRRAMEDEIADFAGVNAGDVLIHAPKNDPDTREHSVVMNRKVARMKVLWHTRRMNFDEIDDELVRPRLQQVMRAHVLLWSIRVFVSPRLTEEEVERVRGFCRLNFLCRLDGRENEKRRLLGAIVDDQLRVHGDGKVQQLSERRLAAVDLLASAARGTLRERMPQALSLLAEPLE